MAVTAYTLPGTAAQAVQGGSAWTNVNNVKLNDASYATDGFLGGADNFEYRHVRLMIGGSIVGTDIGANQDTFTNPRTLGGATELFGQTPTPAQINDPGFGIAIAWGKNISGVHSDKTDYIQVSNFGFAIPGSAVVNGIEIQVAADQYAGGGGTSGLEVNYIQVRIYYTFNYILNAVGSSSGLLYTPAPNRKPKDKHFRHLIFDHNNNFIGDHTKLVTSETTFKQDINNMQSSMDVTIEQNEISTPVAIQGLVTEGDETLLTEDDNELLADVATPAGVGPGTTVEVNNNIEVSSYFGQFVELLTESGEPLVTESDELIMVADGYPEGKRIWTGWMSDFDLDFGTTDNIVTKYLSHASELSNIMLETADSTEIVSSSADASWIRLVGTSGGPGDEYGAAQVFTPGATFKMSRFVLDKVRNDYISNSTARVSIYVGGNPNSVGAFVASADCTLVYDPDNYPTIQSLQFLFSNPPTLSSGQAYTAIFESVGTFKTGGSATWPLNIYTATGYGGGNAWQIANGTGYNDLGKDVLFTVWEAGGDTTVTFNSYDPSQIFREALAFARTRGARANYSNQSIPLSGTVVSYTFKANTIDEVFSKVLELLPADWYGYYDPGENIAYLQPRPTTVGHYYTRKVDVMTLVITRTIRKMINDVYFTGGGTPALFARVTDQPSVTAWRRALSKKSDQRVTDLTTARILSRSDINRYKNPLHAGGLVAVPVNFSVEDVVIGELAGFINFGGYVDALALQIVSKTYHPDEMEGTLSVLLPPISKRVEDINRNLDTVEQENLPSSPS